VRDSSLSASTQAVVAAWVGHGDLVMEYLIEAATIDLNDLRDDVDDGLHIAALGGAWTAVVSGLGGMKDGPNGLEFCPRLVAPVTRLEFGTRTGGRMLRIEVSGDTALYTLSGGTPLHFRHFGQSIELGAGEPVRLPIPPATDPGPRPSQPKGRSPEEVRASRGD
ncbi:MAG TPA: glycosyl hydrolase family 65 protein, partial [Microbacterium sp.]|nr:glycosyl hydrolase family 65 protein [Microbacterium sp.]